MTLTNACRFKRAFPLNYVLVYDTANIVRPLSILSWGGPSLPSVVAILGAASMSIIRGASVISEHVPERSSDTL